MLRICPKCGKVAGYNSWFNAFYCRNCGELRICPKCGKVAGYNSWFKAFYCRNCGELFNGGADDGGADDD